MKLKMLPIKAMGKSLSSFVKAHTPEILTGIGAAGLISAVVLSVKGTKEAMPILEEKEKEKGEALTAVETVKAAWKCYVPAACATAVSLGCIMGSASVSVRRTTAIATAYKFSESAFDEYREKMVQALGEKKEERLREEIAAETADKVVYDEKSVFETGMGNTLCLDAMSGRYFKSDIESIKQAVNKLNYRLIQQNEVSLNEFYDELGLDNVDIGDDLGWRVEKGLMEVSFGSRLKDGSTPCLTLKYKICPLAYY